MPIRALSKPPCGTSPTTSSEQPGGLHDIVDLCAHSGCPAKALWWQSRVRTCECLKLLLLLWTLGGSCHSVVCPETGCLQSGRLQSVPPDAAVHSTKPSCLY